MSVEQIIAGHDIVVFVSNGCPYCSQAIDALRSSGYGAKLHVVEATPEQRKSLRDKTTASSVPNIWVKGTFVGGCNDGPQPWMGVRKLINNGKLQEMLCG